MFSLYDSRLLSISQCGLYFLSVLLILATVLRTLAIPTWIKAATAPIARTTISQTSLAKFALHAFQKYVPCFSHNAIRLVPPWSFITRTSSSSYSSVVSNTSIYLAYLSQPACWHFSSIYLQCTSLCIVSICRFNATSFFCVLAFVHTQIIVVAAFVSSRYVKVSASNTHFFFSHFLTSSNQTMHRHVLHLACHHPPLS